MTSDARNYSNEAYHRAGPHAREGGETAAYPGPSKKYGRWRVPEAVVPAKRAERARAGTQYSASEPGYYWITRLRG